MNQTKQIIVALSGDRTKHLKNIHGVLKSATSTTGTGQEAAIVSGNNGVPPVNQAFIVEDTSSSISSFQSTSDQSSLAGSLVESPTKNEPLDSAFNAAASSAASISMTSNLNSSSTSMLTMAETNDDTMTETITMTLEDINQFAQDIY